MKVAGFKSEFGLFRSLSFASIVVRVFSSYSSVSWISYLQIKI